MNDYPRTSQEWLDANHDRLVQLRETADSARRAAESTVGRATTRDGTVSVVVAPSGDVVSLQISDAALKRGGVRLAESIVATMREARRIGTAAVRDALADLENADNGADVLAALGLHTTSSPQPTVEVAEDDWGEASFLHRA